jgi:hypothetical protein
LPKILKSSNIKLLLLKSKHPTKRHTTILTRISLLTTNTQMMMRCLPLSQKRRTRSPKKRCKSNKLKLIIFTKS